MASVPRIATRFEFRFFEKENDAPVFKIVLGDENNTKMSIEKWRGSEKIYHNLLCDFHVPEDAVNCILNVCGGK